MNKEMKNYYCSRCKTPYKKIYKCKYEKNEKGWFLLCTKCIFECSKIYKKAFKFQYGKMRSVGLLKTRKERSSIKP